NGCHAFDIVAFLFGTVTRVHATRLKPLQSLSVEDSATILVSAGRGLVGRIDLSWSLSTGRESYVTVYGSEGTIAVGWHGSHLRPAGHPPVQIGKGYDKAEAHRNMLESFSALVAGSGAPWISPGECLRTVAAVEAAYSSLSSGGWVAVDMARMRAPRPAFEASAGLGPVWTGPASTRPRPGRAVCRSVAARRSGTACTCVVRRRSATTASSGRRPTSPTG